MLGPSATMKPALKPAINGLPRSILAVEFLARRKMALEPELLKLALPAFLRLRQLGRQYASWDASWAVAAGAAGTVLHKLVRLVLLRHPKQRPLSLQLARAERAGLLLRSEGDSVPPLPGGTVVLGVGPLRGRIPFLFEAAESLKGPEGRLDRRRSGPSE